MFFSRSQKRPIEFAEKISFLHPWSKAHFFFVIYIYLLNFLSQLIKNKSGQVGFKPANPHEHWVSAWPLSF
jgi:hypothetical protein